jgi:hypothetical protein
MIDILLIDSFPSIFWFLSRFRYIFSDIDIATIINVMQNEINLQQIKLEESDEYK